jgi:hypothetical protein
MRALRRNASTAVIHLARFELESAREAEFGDWYESEHVPAMLARPGWRRMRRYLCTDGRPHISLYDIDDHVAAGGSPSVSEAPFRSGRFAARGIRDYHARTWREIHSAGVHLERPEWLNVVTVDIEDAHAGEFNRWYNEVHVPEILRCPGWIANRRYECVDGEPRFLAVYDLEDDERPFNSPEWEAAVGWDDHVGQIRGFHGFRVYRLIFDSADAA